MASTTAHNLQSSGSSVKRGTAIIANGNTISTGLVSIAGMIITSQDADVVFSLSSTSGGTATVGVFAAGSASASTQDCSWIAWTQQKV